MQIKLMEESMKISKDMFIEVGSYVVNVLTKTRKRVCSETILCNTHDLYMTIEPRLTLNDPIHHYVCRYVRKDNRTPYLKSMKTFVISVSCCGELKYGVNTNECVCDYDIITRFIDLLCDMYRIELDKYTKKENGQWVED